MQRTNHQTLTRDEVETAFGAGVADSVFRKKRPGKEVLVPDTDDLRIGDVVLCRPKRKQALKKPPQIERHQSTIPRLQSSDAATWQHAMLYIGRLHVAESTTWFKSNQRLTTGVRVSPLVVVGDNIELLVRRRIASADSFEEFRQSAAMYALTDFALARKSYGFDRIAKMAMHELRLAPKVLAKFVPTNFEKSLICSEYVLQCLAIGGQMLTPEWLSLDDETFFYPADFAVHSAFETVPISYKRLVTYW